MICKRCAIAGDMVAETRSMNTESVVKIGIDPATAPDVVDTIPAEFFFAPIKEAVRSVAHVFHGLCKGCDCQHKVDFERKTIQ